MLHNEAVVAIVMDKFKDSLDNMTYDEMRQEVQIHLANNIGELKIEMENFDCILTYFHWTSEEGHVTSYEAHEFDRNAPMAEQRFKTFLDSFVTAS